MNLYIMLHIYPPFFVTSARYEFHTFSMVCNGTQKSRFDKSSVQQEKAAKNQCWVPFLLF